MLQACLLITNSLGTEILSLLGIIVISLLIAFTIYIFMFSHEQVKPINKPVAEPVSKPSAIGSSFAGDGDDDDDDDDPQDPVPAVKCPNCLKGGKTVWVIPGRNCPQCGTPCS